MEKLPRLTAEERIKLIVDEGTFVECDINDAFVDPLKFPSYKEKILEEKAKTGLREAVITGTGEILGNCCKLIIMDSHYMMGTMGVVVGEKICRIFEQATIERLPVIAVVASGGARVQEGILSLVQMVKTSGVVYRHNERGLLYISVVTDPTMGGVAASFASLADIIISEPEALYGFTGQKIIKETLNRSIPVDFQKAEQVIQNGLIDIIVERERLKALLATLLEWHK